MSLSLQEIRSAIDPNTARVLWAEHISEPIASLRSDAERNNAIRELVMFVFDQLPPLRTLNDQIIGNLADVAESLWPEWYGLSTEVSDPVSLETLFHNHLVSNGDLRTEVSLAWFQQAFEYCRHNRPPVIRGATGAVSIRQLALAINHQDLLIVFAIDDPNPPAERLSALARTAEWVARESAARVVVLIPESLRSSAELDPISFAPLAWEGTSGLTKAPTTEPTDEPPKSVTPWIGRPHPNSPGEQRLAEKLPSDPLLAGLFVHNVSVYSSRGSRFVVDLLWQDGRVIVEIDGYSNHSNRAAFQSDRQRDYELLISGYFVLRLAHAEVESDVELALDKIRDVVKFRRQQGIVAGELS